MKLTITLVLGLVALCHCSVLNVRQADSESNGQTGPTRVIILRQFEEWVRLLQSSMTRLSDQFNRILAPREGRLSSEDLKEAKETLREIDGQIAGMNGVFLSRDAGALQSNQNRDFSLSRVPVVGEIEDMLRLAQKQITDVSSTITRALTGGLNLQGTTAEEMNKNINGGPVMSTVPFLKEMEEYLQLFQRQLNRLGGTVQRVIGGGQSGSQ